MAHARPPQPPQPRHARLDLVLGLGLGLGHDDLHLESAQPGPAQRLALGAHRARLIGTRRSTFRSRANIGGRNPRAMRSQILPARRLVHLAGCCTATSRSATGKALESRIPQSRSLSRSRWMGFQCSSSRRPSRPPPASRSGACRCRPRRPPSA
eukprot:scaffold67951_cov69-Phaeocystis_antarctica.AAC.7